MRTSLVTIVLATVLATLVALGTAGAAPAAPTSGGGDAGSRCGAGISATPCIGIVDLPGDRDLRARLAAR